MKNPMNRGVLVSLCAFVLLGVAACAGSGDSTSSSPASPSIAVSYVDSDSIPAVAVVVSHPQPLASVELVAPDGRFVSAPQVEQDLARGPGSLPPSVGVGVFGGSGGGFGTGVGLGFPLGGSPAPPVTGNRARARIVIPDPEAYRRDWEKYVVRLRFGTAPEPFTIAEIPAPPPRR
jgi:hypothetical protein